MGEQQQLKDIQVKFEEIYLSACANRQENGISCQGNYLLYSRSNCPVIYDLREKRIVVILIGHTDRINNQHFVDSSLYEQEKDSSYTHLISTSHDRTSIIWELNRESKDYKILYQFKAPNESSFTAIGCYRDQDGNYISITTSIDCSICLWHNDELKHILETRYCCFEAKFFTLTANGLKYKFLFLAGSDNKIRVFQVYDGEIDYLFELIGHSDWIKCLDVVDLGDRELEFLLASASQDTYVRVWHMKVIDHELDMSQQVRTSVSKSLRDSSNNNLRLTSTLETVLSGHEGIVHGLCWFKNLERPALQLISCSADKTIILWKSSIAPPINLSEPDEHQKLNRYEQCPASADVWQKIQRVGETGETNLPFLGVCLSQDENTFYALSLRGAIHSWSYDKRVQNWTPQCSIMGHFEPITDICWERSGNYLLTSSLDKTCRLHAVSSIDRRWNEISRPQVHGHEINCLVSIDSITFASGSEEKTIRVFKATQFFMKNFEFLGEPKNLLDKVGSDQICSLPKHAQLPALGLSNKSAESPYGDVVGGGDSSASSSWYAVSELVEHLAKIDHLDSLPIEEILLQSTLWCETHKLFGHGNELYALAVDSTSSYLASASKANRSDLANILIWDCVKFRKNATIEHHSLTITRLRFSPDDRFLLSVSRDRTWCLSEKTGIQKPSYKKMIGTTKENAIHERIIWDCCWTHDSKYFITVSRDKKAILWSLEQLETLRSSEHESQIDCLVSRHFDSSIQAVDSPVVVQQGATDYLFAFGLENGTLELHMLTIRACDSRDQSHTSSVDWRCLISIPQYHHLSIRRLAFRPSVGCNKENWNSINDGSEARGLTIHLLASGSDDCIVKLTQFCICGVMDC